MSREQDWASLTASRLARVRRGCSRMRSRGELRESWLLPENFFTSTRWSQDGLSCWETPVMCREGVTWCPLYKAGSSTWTRNMLVLEGVDMANRCWREWAV